MADRGRPHLTVWRMRCSCWKTKATNTHSEHVIIIAFPLQQRLRERAAMLRYTHIARRGTVRQPYRTAVPQYYNVILQHLPLCYNYLQYSVHAVQVCSLEAIGYSV